MRVSEVRWVGGIDGIEGSEKEVLKVLSERDSKVYF